MIPEGREEVTGDFDVQVRVTRLDPTAFYAKAGLMVRADLNPDSANAKVIAFPNAGANFIAGEVRPRPGEEMFSWHATGYPSDIPDCWLRMQRVGERFTWLRSGDGVMWDIVGRIPLEYAATVHVGLCVVSGVYPPDHAFTTAHFRDYSRSSTVTPTIDVFGGVYAAEAAGRIGHFTIQASPPPPSPLTVTVALGGSASAGADYVPVATTLTIPAGQSSIVIPIKPVNDIEPEGIETVTVTLLPSAEYFLGSATAEVTILDDHGPVHGLKREIYRNVFDTHVSDLTGAPSFPDAPSEVGFVSVFESLSLGDNYGQRLTGWLVPPIDGNYVFYLAGDDQAELWLSTDDTPGSLNLIAREPVWNPSRDWLTTDRRDPDNPENRSVPIPLVGGQAYYVQVLQKEGGGGDHVAVTWILEGDTPPPSGSDPIQAAHLLYRFPASISTLEPNQAVGGSGGFTMTVRGQGFAAGSEVLWNGSPRSTSFVSSEELTAAIGAGDVAGGELISTAVVTVRQPDATVSNPLAFTIDSVVVAAVESAVAEPGSTIVVSTAPTDPDAELQVGVTATLVNPPDAPPVTVTAATYSEDPGTGPVFEAAGGFVDLQVTGATPETSMTASIYYPQAVVGDDELALQLLYFDGDTWESVLSSGGAPPEKDMTDNRDGTVSGGRFTIVFDATSTPAVTDLAGTVFASAAVLPDVQAPTLDCPTLVEVPCSDAALVPVTFSVTASDEVDPSPVVQCSPASGSLFPVGETLVTCTATDASGNVSECQFVVRRLPLTFGGFLEPVVPGVVKEFKLGSVIPVKFQAACGGTPLVTGSHRLSAVRIEGGPGGGSVVPVQAPGSSNTGTAFRWADGHWMYNLDTKAWKLAAGTYELTVTLSDGSRHSVFIEVK